MAIYQNFDQVTSVIALIVMAAVALLQSQCYFQLALEQLCIIVDQIQRSSITEYVIKT